MLCPIRLCRYVVSRLAAETRLVGCLQMLSVNGVLLPFHQAGELGLQLANTTEGCDPDRLGQPEQQREVDGTTVSVLKEKNMFEIPYLHRRSCELLTCLGLL